MTAHNDNIEQCKSIFISWQWGLTVIIGELLTIVAIAWAGAGMMSDTKNAVKDHDSRITNVEYVIKSNNNKLDTIIKMLGQK